MAVAVAETQGRDGTQEGDEMNKIAFWTVLLYWGYGICTGYACMLLANITVHEAHIAGLRLCLSDTNASVVCFLGYGAIIFGFFKDNK